MTTTIKFSLHRPKLPEYVLDFGYVVLGTQRTHVVRATNTGWFPVSFKMDKGGIHSMGFYCELDRVRNLPGAPDNETVDFVVTFDPRAANLQLGPVESLVPINVSSFKVFILISEKLSKVADCPIETYKPMKFILTDYHSIFRTKH